MTAPAGEVASMNPSTATAQRRTGDAAALRTYRLNIMRIGYLVMAVGLAIRKWPLFVQGTADSLPVFEGVVAALLVAMGLLAYLGLRYPVQMLPILVFESLWKSIWLAAIALPHLIAGDMSPEMTTMMFSVLVYVVILAVTPWDYVWKRYVTAAGDPWR
jgi:hypothetical protein